MPLYSLASILSKSLNQPEEQEQTTGWENLFQPSPAQPKTAAETAMTQNVNARGTLEELGIEDPTKKKGPSMLERIFGPLDVPGAGIRTLIHNVTTSGTDLSAWEEMGKAARGEQRVEWSHILEDYGVTNKWVRMIGGLALDILTDPVTYIGTGLPKVVKAAKASMSVMLSDDILRGVDIAAKWGDDVADAVKGVSTIADLPASEAARLNELLLSRASRGWHVAQETAEDGSKVLRLLQGGGPTSTGGVRWMGIPIAPVQPQLNRLAAGTKDFLRGVPGSELFERAFIHGAATPTFRKLAGNEPALDVVRRMRRELSAGRHVADLVGDALRKELEKIEPDPKMRDFISLAIGDQFADNLDEIAYRFGETTEALNRRRAAFRQILDAAGIRPGEYGGDIDEMINAALKRLDELETKPFSKTTGGMTAGQVVEAGRTEVGGATRYLRRGVGQPVAYEELPEAVPKAALSPERQAELNILQEQAAILKDRLKGSANYYKNAKATAKARAAAEAEEAAAFQFGDEAGEEFAKRVSDEDVQRIIDDTMEYGGVTYDPIEGRFFAPEQDTGVAASMFPRRNVPVARAEDLTPAQVRKFIADNMDMLEQNKLYMGTWKNAGGTIDLDVSTLLPEDMDPDELIRILEEAGQDAGFRFSVGFEEPTTRIGQWRKGFAARGELKWSPKKGEGRYVSGNFDIIKEGVKDKTWGLYDNGELVDHFGTLNAAKAAAKGRMGSTEQMVRAAIEGGFLDDWMRANKIVDPEDAVGRFIRDAVGESTDPDEWAAKVELALKKQMGYKPETSEAQWLERLSHYGVGGKQAPPMPKAKWAYDKKAKLYNDASGTVQIVQDSQRNWFLDIVDENGVLWNYPEHFGVGGRSYNTLAEAKADADDFIKAVVGEVQKLKGMSPQDYEALGLPKAFARHYGIEPLVSKVETKVANRAAKAGAKAAGEAAGFGLTPTPRPKRNTFAWAAWLDAHPEKADLDDEREVLRELNQVITRMGQLQTRSDKRLGGLAAQAPRRIRELTDEVIRAARAQGKTDLKIGELSRAISRYFEADDAVNTTRVSLNELLDGISREDNVRAALERVGVKGDDLEKAIGVYKRVESEYGNLLDIQQKAGLDVPELFSGMGGARTRPLAAGYQPGYQPSLSKTRREKRAATEAMREFGIPDDIVRRRATREGFAHTERMTPLEDVSKEYLTEEDRLLGITLDDRLRMGKLKHGKVVQGPQRKLTAKAGVSPLETELDVAQQAGKYKSQALKSLATKEYRDNARKLAGDDDLLFKMLTEAEPVFTSDKSMRSFLRYYDKALNVWKRAATIWNVPFFPARNKISNQFLMWVENSVDPEFLMNPVKSIGLLHGKGSVRIGDEVYKAGDGTLDALIKRAQDNRVVVGQPEIAELVGLGGGGSGPLTKAGSYINQNLVEDADRLTAWITNLRKGLDDAAAAEMVDQALYSYAPDALTAFEREFMRRVVPFYTFARRNLPHMAETLAKTPGKMTWAGHLKETGEDVQPIEESVMPDWMRSLFPIPLPTKTAAGMPLMVSTAGVLPFGDFEKLDLVRRGKLDVRDAIGQMSPLVKLPLELIFNKDIYYESEISRYPGETRRVPGYIEQFDDLVADIPVIGDVWGAVKDTFGIDEKVDKQTGEPFLVANAVAMKILKDLNPWMNNMGKLMSEDPRYQMFSLGYMTGVKTMPFDVQRFSEQQLYEDRAVLQDAIQRLKDEGVIQPAKPARKGVSLVDIIKKGGGQ